MASDEDTERAKSICRMLGYDLCWIASGGRKPEVVAARIELVEALRNGGWTVRKIASVVGVTEYTVYDYLRGKVAGKWT